MRRRRLWLAGGALLVVIVGASLLIWRPWRIPYGNQAACTAYRENAQPGQPICITWAQANRRYPTWVRQPSWLPSTVQWQQLTVNRPLGHDALPPPGLTIWYQLPHATIQIQENPTVVGVGARHTRASRLDGQPDHVAGWTVRNPGERAVHLKELWFDADHHWYMVTGVNASWADVDGVAASLIK